MADENVGPNVRLTNDKQSIVALCTGNVRAAIALIRISGVDSWQIAAKGIKLPREQELLAQRSHSVHYATVVDGQQVVDQVMVLLMRAPHTFTGQDTVEITCHGNPLLTEKIIALFIKHGARLATPGEFSQRALQNGKIDLLQAEAVCELVRAGTQLGVQQAMRKLKAGLSHEIEKLERLILRLIATIEASFEFLEEEERDVDFGNVVQQAFVQLMAASELLQASCKSQQQLTEGVKVVLLGVPNAGKSTLFNCLLGCDKAIVHASAGTTRDSLDALVMQQEQLWTLVDTAGIRQSDDEVELEGIARALAAAQTADVILLLIDPTQDLAIQLQLNNSLQADFAHKIIPVCSKVNLSTNEQLALIDKHFPLALKISAKETIGLPLLRQAVAAKISQLFAQMQSLFSLNQRQRLLLKRFFAQLHHLEGLFKVATPGEILILELRELLQHLTELTGRELQEELLTEVFANFCVGK